MHPQGSTTPQRRTTLAMSLYRGLRLRCPVCGKGRLFETWLRMHKRCTHCQTSFERGPGYYLGSIYINYGLTALMVTGGYLSLFFTDTFSPGVRLMLLGGFCVLFPLWFFRYARSLWLAFDCYVDPDQLNNRRDR